MKEETFWEFRKNLRGRREERQTAIKDKKGKITENPEEIK